MKTLSTLITNNLLSLTLGMSEQTLAVFFIVFATLTAVLLIIVVVLTVVLLVRGKSAGKRSVGSTVTKYKPEKQKQQKPAKHIEANKQAVGPTFVPFTETVPTVPLSSKVKETKSDGSADVIRRTNAVLQELNTNKPEKKKANTTPPPTVYEPKIKQQPTTRKATASPVHNAPQRTTRSSTTRPTTGSTTHNTTRRK